MRPPLHRRERADQRNRRYRCRYWNTVEARDWRCDSLTILADDLDDVVWGKVVELLGDPSRLRAAATSHAEILDLTLDADTDALERAQAEEAKIVKALGQVNARALKEGWDDAVLERHPGRTESRSGSRSPAGRGDRRDAR